MRLYVPGRVCLVGEHSDWAGGYRRTNRALERGYTVVCGTNQGISAEVEPHPTHLILSSVTTTGEQIGPVEIPMTREALLAEAQSGSFWSYISGVAYQIMDRYRVGGLVLHNDHTDLPVKKGLSSSAAICVLTARAFNEIYRLGLNVRDEMELAYQGEITTPSQCGRMDQACAFGGAPVLMIFDDDHLETRPIRVGVDLHLVVVDLMAQKNTRVILKDLNSCFPYAQNPVQEGVQKLLGRINRDTVSDAIEAIARGNPEALGAIMAQAQSNFDQYAIPACPQELSAPELHRVLAMPELQAHIYGGKGVGSQGDGSAQFLARSEEDQQAIIDLLHKKGLPSYALTIRKNI